LRFAKAVISARGTVNLFDLPVTRRGDLAA
jgi:hypothetical protein